jgi:hypothetical protein
VSGLKREALESLLRQPVGLLRHHAPTVTWRQPEGPPEAPRKPEILHRMDTAPATSFGPAITFTLLLSPDPQPHADLGLDIKLASVEVTDG